ncbi:MAG: hypothetical protein M1586_02740 [Patescibacteria group bacterium]|nr:hypothetical protein [Patescibacteria group bacterium]MCL5262188.1 hypothetical protein [Patescibacteria group bacterium]
MGIGLLGLVIAGIGIAHCYHRTIPQNLWFIGAVVSMIGLVFIFLPSWGMTALLVLPASIPVYCLVRAGRRTMALYAAIGLVILILAAHFQQTSSYTIVRLSDRVEIRMTMKGWDEGDGVKGPDFTKLGQDYPGWRFRFSPAGVDIQVRFPGKERQFWGQEFGLQNGTPVFFGPEGTEILITLLPPKSAP